jgi:hypothetical protein
MTRLLDCLTRLLLGKRRIDHNPMYVCMMVWDLFAGAFAVVVGLPDGAMTRMTLVSQTIICWLMFLGGVSCVWGIVMGTKVDPYYWIATWMRRNNQIDIRIPYLMGMAGTPMLMVAFFFYSVAIFSQMSWQPTMASEVSLSFIFGIGVTLNFLRFLLEIRRIGERLPELILREMQMRMGEEPF